MTKNELQAQIALGTLDIIGILTDIINDATYRLRAAEMLKKEYKDSITPRSHLDPRDLSIASTKVILSKVELTDEFYTLLAALLEKDDE